MDLLEFSLRDRRFALPLSNVQRVIQAAAPTPLPGAPESVLGVLNIGGELAVVVDIAGRLGLPSSPLCPSQQMIVAHASDLDVAVVVDAIGEVISRAALPLVPPPPHATASAVVDGVLALEDGLSVICKPEEFLLSHERALVHEAMQDLPP